MKKYCIMAFAALPLIVTSCATPPPPRQAYFNTDPSALVIKSLGNDKSQMVRPTATAPENNDLLADQARALPQHNTAVVILENYTEPQAGVQFRDRGTTWFASLRNLGYRHIIFLQGKGNAADGLPLVARYD